jgi:3-deoxy-manno-octulosonate cytidylyltransferase (CMP-KDO synthetase)
MRIIGIIPARYQSERFPGKPLIDLAGKTMIARTYEQASKVKSFSEIVVATDDQDIYDEVVSFCGKVVMTSSNHCSGTDRCADVMKQLGYNSRDVVVVNIQGDEPFILPEQIEELIHCFDNNEIGIATLIKEVDSEDDLLNSNIVKVVKTDFCNALYFSRFPIPFKRNTSMENIVHYRHIGMYAYRGDILNRIVDLPVSSLERAESLEQLRWLQAGYTIYTHITQYESAFGIDTPDDVKKAIQYIQHHHL